MIKKILIANRGEIAIRIIRTCKEMNIKTVAVYSTADKDALHTQIADEAICIGGPSAADSYLNMNSIIQAACNRGCDAIHPGCGFLSENSKFAELVEECGLIFIGPDANIINNMGNKNKARKIMQKAGLSIIPGTKEIIKNITEGIKTAEKIGFPVIIKAVNGGGGRGMRIVRNKNEFENAYYSAKSEAKTCFGDEDVFLEKYIENPKHIEVQVIGDKFGNVVHLYERDCSFQRRNQKMIEESPCLALNNNVRNQLFHDAVNACKYIKYNSIGTIEFLLDSNNNYYFIEMNTRIQVEHPITEMITGIDLVKTQILIAAGVPLKYQQKDISCNGYALECRINAEDIKNDFAPSAGKITFMHTPGGKGVRIDSAIYCGYEVPSFYDSMLLKIITFAPTRLECIKKMRWALSELIIDGVKTNSEFHYLILHNPKFIEGRYDTSLAQNYIKELKEFGNII